MLFDDRFTESGDDGSCTHFWSLGKDKYLLTFFSHRTGSHHMLGNCDQETLKFQPESHTYHNIGPSTVSPDPKKRDEQIIISNLGKNEAASVGTWGAVFSIPRRMSLGEMNIVHVEPVESLKTLRVFVDISFVEGFANRQAYNPLRVYPKREDSLGVSVRAQKGGARISKATAWPMKPVW
jgi:hypothetical protein